MKHLNLHILRRTALALAVASALPAWASDAAPAQPVDGASAGRVLVVGQAMSDMERRRDESAAKQIIGHDELVKYGDTSLVEALKRLPGITTGGAPGRGGDIRMRGLGNGYTLILLNGEMPARGFPLDSISPEMIDRVELIPASTAEYSAQGIAGTINLVLKVRRPMNQNEAKAGVGLDRGRLQPSVSTQYSNGFKGGGYTLSAFLNRYDQVNDSSAEILDTDLAGVPRQREDDVVRATRRGTVAGFNPRIGFNLGGDMLSILPFWFHREGSEHTLTSSAYQAAAAGLPLASQQDSSSRVDSLRTTATWTHRLQAAGKLELKAGFNVNQSRADSLLSESGASGALLDRRDSDDVDDHGWTGGLKWMGPARGGHALSLGAEAEDNRRSQDSASTYALSATPGLIDARADVDVDIRRYAAFVQDEWTLSPQWSANLGLRWETLRFNTSVLGGARTDTDSSVLSPLLHLAWKLSPQRKDQVRLSFSRSYKSPVIGDLVPWTVLSARNSATLPDRTGNPALAPEVARGWDLAYERYVGRNGILSVSGFSRSIDHLIRRTVSLRNGRWISTPVNLDGARSSGVTVEAKLRLDDLVPTWAGVELHANYSRYWSDVDGVPGPDNRLDEQPKQVLNAGFDYAFKSLPLSFGANANWTPDYRVQATSTEIRDYGLKRSFDLYGLWRLSPRASLRVSANNLSHSDYLTGSTVTCSCGIEQRWNTAATSTNVGALLSLRF